MALPYVYRIPLPSTSVSVAKTLIQVKAGAAGGFMVISARLWQITKTATEQWDLQLLKKSGAATVTSQTPTPLEPNDPAALCVGGTSATGYNASAEGTDSTVYFEDGWNLLQASWTYLPVPEERIWVPAGIILALKLISTPGAAYTMGGQLVVAEWQ